MTESQVESGTLIAFNSVFFRWAKDFRIAALQVIFRWAERFYRRAVQRFYYQHARLRVAIALFQVWQHVIWQTKGRHPLRPPGSWISWAHHLLILWPWAEVRVAGQLVGGTAVKAFGPGSQDVGPHLGMIFQTCANAVALWKINGVPLFFGGPMWVL